MAQWAQKICCAAVRTWVKSLAANRSCVCVWAQIREAHCVASLDKRSFPCQLSQGNKVDSDRGEHPMTAFGFCAHMHGCLLPHTHTYASYINTTHWGRLPTLTSGSTNTCTHINTSQHFRAYGLWPQTHLSVMQHKSSRDCTGGWALLCSLRRYL